MAGKNHLEKSFRLLFDDSGGTQRDLSGDLVVGSCNLANEYNQVSMHGVSEAFETMLAGYAQAPVTAEFYLNDTATTGAYTVLQGMAGNNTGGTLTLQFGQNGSAPTTGDPEWEGEYILFSISPSPSNERWVMSCTFNVKSGNTPAWGTVA